VAVASAGQYTVIYTLLGLLQTDNHTITSSYM